MINSNLISPPPNWSLVKRSNGTTVVSDLRIADGFWSRMAGLQFRKTLPAGRALLLTKTRSVHTFWMRFSLDMTFIGVEGDVLQIRRAVAPWRMTVGPKHTHAILESKTGWIELEPGDRLVAVCANSPEFTRRQKSLCFLDPITAQSEYHEHFKATETEHQHA